MKTNVYVDGFNLYYGCLKRTPYRWLDLAALCQHLLPQHTIHRIRYFTALVQPRGGDLQQPQRQQTYIRALETIPNLTVHYGHYLLNETWMPLAQPLPSGPKTVKVIKTEEKGSDVNIATHMLVDGFEQDYEAAVLISNDSDLYLPLEIIRNRLRRTVGLLNPHKSPSRQLFQIATFYKPIRSGVLKASLFPDSLVDSNGIITKPNSW